mmetsp:Transcript_6191/g.13482  ORF Transcript_6191/g.13482 Transcript_6191/m.13482 type:complete len:317 (-) Transcript_6191:902-1852(-)
MVQVYTENLSRRHYSSIVSLAFLGRLALFLTAVAVSLVVAYATGGFWSKIKPTLQQPEVHYTYDAMLLFEGSEAGQEMIWTSSSFINNEFASAYVPASVQVAEEDLNNDNKPDVISFVADVHTPNPVYGVKALLQFKYEYTGTVRLNMYSLAYFAWSSATPGGVLYTDGELMLQQKSPITDRKYNDLYNYPILNSQFNMTEPLTLQAVQASYLQFESIIKSYLDRNYTTTYSNVFPVWKPSQGLGFELNMRIRIPPNQVVWYRPQVIEQLKFGWIQFLATYIVLWWLFSWLEFFVFKYRMLTTRVVSDVQPRIQKF